MSYYNEESRGYYGQNQPQSSSGPPQVPYPWVAEWDERDGRWIYINRDNGERTFQHPQPSYGGGGGYGERSYEQGYGGQGYGGQEQREYYEQQPEKKDHTVRNTVLGAAAGVLGGALLMHEGEKVEDKFDDAKYAVEDDFRDGVQDVENFPDNAARWTGEKVQDVEDIPENVERKWDDGVQDVEDIPDDVSGWAGRKVGDVERFGDNLDNSYDQGRNDARYNDDY